MPFRDLDAYIKQARRANSDRELFSCSEAAARQLGLPWLAIVQSTVENAGGTVRIDSVAGAGTTVGLLHDPRLVLYAASLTKEQLGGPKVAVDLAGSIDNVAASEEECFAMIRKFLSYMPSNVWPFDL